MNMVPFTHSRADAGELARSTTKYAVAAGRLRGLWMWAYSTRWRRIERGRPRQKPPRRTGEAIKGLATDVGLGWGTRKEDDHDSSQRMPE